MLSVSQLQLPYLSPFREGLSFSLPPCRILGVLGQNASGKSTLLKTLCGLLPATMGQTGFNNQPLTHCSPHQRASIFGLLQQDHQTALNISVYETVLSGQYPHLDYFANLTPKARQRTNRAIEQFELTTLVDREVATLSGGERQRVFLAMLYNQNPAVWLLDEPNNHLDLKHQLQLFSLLKSRAAEGTTVICTLHDVNAANGLCTDILAFTPNGDWTFGPVEDVLTADTLKAIYDVDFVAHKTPSMLFWLPRHA